MSSIEQLKKQRAALGERYETSAQAFIDAYIALHAIDLTLANANVAGKLGPVPTFDGPRGVLPHVPRHAEFMRAVAPDTLITQRIHELHNEHLEQFSTEGR